MDRELEIEYPIWRVWLDSNESLKDLKEYWSLVDIRKANALLDMRQDMETAMNEYETAKIKTK